MGFCADWENPYGLCYQKAGTTSNECTADRKFFYRWFFWLQTGRAYGACPWYEYKSEEMCALKGYQITNSSDCNVGGSSSTDFCVFPSMAVLCSDVDTVEAGNRQNVLTTQGERTIYLGRQGGPDSLCFHNNVVQADVTKKLCFIVWNICNSFASNRKLAVFLIDAQKTAFWKFKLVGNGKLVTKLADLWTWNLKFVQFFGFNCSFPFR